jgi:hypothetical protein
MDEQTGPKRADYSLDERIASSRVLLWLFGAVAVVLVAGSVWLLAAAAHADVLWGS